MYKYRKEDFPYIYLNEDDFIFGGQELYEKAKRESFLPLIISEPEFKGEEMIYGFQKEIIENLNGNRTSADKIILKRDLYYSYSSNQSTILELKNKTILFKGKKQGRIYKLFCMAEVESEVTAFAQNKKRVFDLGNEQSEE